MRLFVYGTLLPGLRLHAVLNQAEMVDHGFVEDAALYDLGDFPAMVEGKGRVMGEVFEIDGAVLDRVDYVEGFEPERPGWSLFIRQRVTVWGLSGEVLEAEAYFYHGVPGEESKLLPDGDYRRYLMEREPERPVWLLAYGSNMSRRRLESRVGLVAEAMSFRLTGYQLAFNKEGGKANLMRTPGASAPVVAWRLSREQVRRMDLFEGTPEHYVRMGVTVKLDGKNHLMQVYLANPDRLEPDACPEPEYLAHILTGYREQGFEEAELIERCGAA